MGVGGYERYLAPLLRKSERKSATIVTYISQQEQSPNDSDQETTMGFVMLGEGERAMNVIGRFRDFLSEDSFSFYLRMPEVSCPVFDCSWYDWTIVIKRLQLVSVPDVVEEICDKCFF